MAQGGNDAASYLANRSGQAIMITQQAITDNAAPQSAAHKVKSAAHKAPQSAAQIKVTQTSEVVMLKSNLMWTFHLNVCFLSVGILCNVYRFGVARI